MNLKQLALAAAAGTALLATAPAFADPHWGREHGWRGQSHHPHHHRHYHRAPAYVYLPARPVVVVPPPPPYYYNYAPPAPVFYGQIPISPGLQVGFRVRL